MDTTRRDFLKSGGLASVGLLMSKGAFSSTLSDRTAEVSGNELLSLSYELLQQWADRLISLQFNDPKVPGLNGGILCPACSKVHGRIGDTIYPLMFLAEKKQEQKYLDAAILLYNWREKMVSFPDGSWVNDVLSANLWKGITVFGATSLCEALIYHGHLLDPKTRDAWRDRLYRATEFLTSIITMDYGNINYPVTSAYAYSLVGSYLNDEKFIKLGREFAHQSLDYFTEENSLLFGEGTPKRIKSPKGCYSIDLGYNVEESLPALVLYARLTGDKEVMDVVVRSLKSHLEFMLPDGAWDNSWGTRNFKWTYWGSRTSDGCQPAFALLSDEHPEFYQAALRNTKLLAQCSDNGYLYGGPHCQSYGILPCIHHAFTHCKALATILHKSDQVVSPNPVSRVTLPREKEYGVKSFPDIQTWLVSKGHWRGTITGYDREYYMKNGHATGGALAMLWHNKIGPVITASMNKYTTQESNNMHMDKGINNIPLTPRFELLEGNRLFMNISDLNADISFVENEDEIVFHVLAHLVDEDQNHPDEGSIKCALGYTFRSSGITIKADLFPLKPSQKIKFFLPIISTNNEKLDTISSKQMAIHKPGGMVNIETNVPIHILETDKGRIFNFVPGMEAVPIELSNDTVEIDIWVN
ncbi:MAG: hypothetical protein DHS20C17_30710 [Cyclobacteriaceae bacterium]|nr:MAG: hypothetical protein DHS20C17_30710 [Cyclobacteriaceae bacterium]